MVQTLKPIESIEYISPQPDQPMTFDDQKVTKRGNALMKRLNPSYLLEPRPLDFANDIMSNDFCYDKAYRQILEPLEFKTKKEWSAFCDRVWAWAEAAEQRELEAEAREYLDRLKLNPKLLNLVIANLSESQG